MWVFSIVQKNPSSNTAIERLVKAAEFLLDHPYPLDLAAIRKEAEAYDSEAAFKAHAEVYCSPDFFMLALDNHATAVVNLKSAVAEAKKTFG